MDIQETYYSDDQLQHISPNANVVHYAKLVGQALSCYAAISRDQTERAIFEKRAEIVLQKMTILENKLLSDSKDLHDFITDSMEAINNLIKDKQYAIADSFHQRVAENLQGRVSYIAEAFNKVNATGDVHLIEE